MIPDCIVDAQANKPADTEGRTQAVPSTGVPSGSCKTPATAMPAATSPAGSRAAPAARTSPQSPHSGPPTRHSQSRGSHEADGLSAPASPDRHTRTATPSVHPCRAFRYPRSNCAPTESPEKRGARGQLLDACDQTEQNRKGAAFCGEDHPCGETVHTCQWRGETVDRQPERDRDRSGRGDVKHPRPTFQAEVALSGFCAIHFGLRVRRPRRRSV